MHFVPCPTCGNQAAFSPENKWRPFCSERCKLIDLGSWAAEQFRIAEQARPSESDDSVSG